MGSVTHGKIGRFACALIACALLAAGCSSPATTARLETSSLVAPAVRSQSSAPTAAPLIVPGIDNFGMVTPTLWRGGMPDETGMCSLAAMHVGTIIDLQETDESKLVPPGVRYVPLRVSAWNVDAVNLAAVLQAIRSCPPPIFIHCHEGRDRTGLAIAAYRLSTGWSVADACAELRQYHVHWRWLAPIEERVRQLGAQNDARVASIAVQPLP